MSLHVKLEHVFSEWLSYEATAQCNDCFKTIPVRMKYSTQTIENNLDQETSIIAKMEIEVETIRCEKYYFYNDRILCADCHAILQEKKTCPSRL